MSNSSPKKLYLQDLLRGVFIHLINLYHVPSGCQALFLARYLFLKYFLPYVKTAQMTIISMMGT